MGKTKVSLHLGNLPPNWHRLNEEARASQWVLPEVNVPFSCVVNSGGGWFLFPYRNLKGEEDSAKLCLFWEETKQMQMDLRGLKNTVLYVHYNKPKLFHSCGDLFFPQNTSLNLSLPLKKMNLTSKLEDSLDSVSFFGKTQFSDWRLCNQ